MRDILYKYVFTPSPGVDYRMWDSPIQSRRWFRRPCIRLPAALGP